MLQRVVEMRWPVTAVLSDETVTRRQDRYLDLHSEQWEILKEIVKSLEPFEIATVFLSYEQNVSISCVYPIIYGIIDNMNITEEDSATCRPVLVREASSSYYSTTGVVETQ